MISPIAAAIGVVELQLVSPLIVADEVAVQVML
jgi:hypothetical protein